MSDIRTTSDQPVPTPACDVCRVWGMTHPAGCQRPTPIIFEETTTVYPTDDILNETQLEDDVTDETRTAPAPTAETEAVWAVGFGRDLDHTAIWDEETGETYGSARARFASFGTLLTARQVYMGVPSNGQVWSFGYGDDPAAFDAIPVTEVEEAVDADGFAATDAAWGPFVVYVEVGQEGIGEEEEEGIEPLTMVTIAFTLPSGVETSVSVDAESVARADALTATLLAAGLSVYREAPRPCADCGQPFEDHGAWSDDLSHTFTA